MERDNAMGRFTYHSIALGTLQSLTPRTYLNPGIDFNLSTMNTILG